MLRKTLYADLKRQFEIEGRPDKAIGLLDMVSRILHPRFLPIILYRLSRAAFIARIPILPQVFSLANLGMFGLEITPRCEIGSGIFFPHTSGTVVGAYQIGKNVTIFQNVTLGSKYLDMGFHAELRPTIKDEVILGAGCKVLGGIVIGDNVTVGANAVVVDSIQEKSLVVGCKAKSIVRE